MSGIFALALKLSLAGGVVCLLVFGVSVLLKARVPKAWLSALWLVAVLRFVIPVSPNLPVSLPSMSLPQAVSSVLSNIPAGSTRPQSGGAQAETVYGMIPASANAPHLSGQTYSEGPALPTAVSGPESILVDIWLTGAAGMFLWCLIGYCLTKRKLRKGRVLLCSDKVPVYESRSLQTPVLAGLLRPAIYLPEGFVQREMAVRHELCHLERCDLWRKWFIQLIVCVHWFNPAVYLMRREANRLSELACDEAVVRGMDDTGRRSYANMLLHTVKSASGSGGLMVASLGREKERLKGRLLVIMNCNRTTKKAAAVMAFLTAVTLSAAVLAGSVMLGGCGGKPDSAAAAPSMTSTQRPAPASAVNTVSAEKLPFVNDPDLIGTWERVDEVQNMEDYNPAVKTEKQDHLTYVFAADGTMNYPSMSWTKGKISIANPNVTTHPYAIRAIDRESYLFVSWGDAAYSYFGVFRRLSDDTSVALQTDNINLPFVDDLSVVGTWEAVDYVRTIAAFNPAVKTTQYGLYLQELVFERNGAMKAKMGDTDVTGQVQYTWTKGAVLSKTMVTASAYEIKEIDGLQYLFFQWKSGDYVYGRMTPCYYVLKKTT